MSCDGSADAGAFDEAEGRGGCCYADGEEEGFGCCVEFKPCRKQV